MMSEEEKKSRRADRRKIAIRGTSNKKDSSRLRSSHQKKLYDLSNERKLVFYASPEWKILKGWLFKRCFYQCVCCRNNANLHVDHIFPISKSPQMSLDFKNIQYLCAECNILKSNYTNKRFCAYTKGGHKKAFSPKAEEVLAVKSMWIKYFPEINKAEELDIETSNFFA